MAFPLLFYAIFPVFSRSPEQAAYQACVPL
jgi:hypothetical protein